MENLYQKSILELQKLQNQPSKKEWNKIAIEKYLLCYTSLRFLSGKSFTKLYKEARQEQSKQLYNLTNK